MHTVLSDTIAYSNFLTNLSLESREVKRFTIIMECSNYYLNNYHIKWRIKCKVTYPITHVFMMIIFTSRRFKLGIFQKWGGYDLFFVSISVISSTGDINHHIPSSTKAASGIPGSSIQYVRIAIATHN